MSDAERTPEQVWLEDWRQRLATWAGEHPEALARIAALVEPRDEGAAA